MAEGTNPVTLSDQSIRLRFMGVFALATTNIITQAVEGVSSLFKQIHQTCTQAKAERNWGRYTLTTLIATPRLTCQLIWSLGQGLIHSVMLLFLAVFAQTHPQSARAHMNANFPEHWILEITGLSQT